MRVCGLLGTIQLLNSRHPIFAIKRFNFHYYINYLSYFRIYFVNI